MTKTKVLSRSLWSLPLALAAAGCSDGKPVDLGHDVAQLSDYAAAWDGYAEAYNFANGGSDRVRITLDQSGDGTIEVGDAALDPTPTDPALPLPGKPGQFHDGFRYPIHAATVEAGRLRFEVDPGERFAAWCAIQTPAPFPEDPSLYICVAIPSDKAFVEGLPGPGGCYLWDAGPITVGGGRSLTNPVEVSCNRYLPCVYQICACTTSACAFDPGQPRPDGYRVRVDGALDDSGANLVGTLAIYADWDHPDTVMDRVTIRMHRVGATAAP